MIDYIVYTILINVNYSNIIIFDGLNIKKYLWEERVDYNWLCGLICISKNRTLRCILSLKYSTYKWWNQSVHEHSSFCSLWSSSDICTIKVNDKLHLRLKIQ